MSPHRTSRAVLAAALAALLMASGCSSPEPAAEGSLSQIVWTQDGGQAPALEFPTPLVVGDSVIEVVQAGDGAVIGAQDAVAIHVTLIDGESGEVMSTTYDTGQEEPLLLSDPMMDRVLIDAIVGQSEGVRLLYARPPEHTGAPATLLMAITVERVVPVLDRAQGSELDLPEGLPEVSLDAAGAPSIVPLDTDEPADMAEFARIVGDGQEVSYGDNVVVHYSGWLWDGTSFDSSWERGGPLLLPLLDGGVIDGWIVGLQDQTVGSQVVLVLPSDFAYGDQGTGPIPPGATLVFVVDILAVI